MTALVEYIEGDSGYGWWRHGWVDKDEFFRDVQEAALREMMLPPDELGTPDGGTKHGYVRESPASDDGWTSLSETPNGGRRATYVWWRL